MLYSTFLSTVVVAASSVANATRGSDPKPAQAKVIPFVNRHAAARKTEDYSHSATSKRDFHRHQMRSERIAAVKRSGNVKQMKRATALEPYDIGPARQATLRKRQGESAVNPLINSEDFLYFGDLSLGTPTQITTIDFDTGSADLIIPSLNCTTCAGPFFKPESSTTFTNLTSVFDISFGDGSAASGVLSADRVAIGTLAVPNQPFALINNSSDSFDGPNAGLMGLAFESIAQSQATPWFFNLANQGALASNVFSFYLTREEAVGSELCVGCIDSTMFTGQPEYFALIPREPSQSVWEIVSNGFAYNNQVVTHRLDAVIDSGASNIYIPPSQAAALYANVPGARLHIDNRHYLFPCDSALTMGPVGMTFAGSSMVFNIQPSRFNLGMVEEGSDMCIGAILSSGNEDGVALVGDAFMSSWYSIFDYGNMRVGFAQAV